ncbi:hypothetical protein K435DRAFT_854050 [Dendrothele bispora CBS 962.96]|uniref:DUF6532 domain-containing protein n=1 Tax=Dendrothele bispora (strain CBS 962.96) TaxID=1314807 RepID=A0A4S8MF40_DENBC|nr:hypothetical protein K435DRAFT_854050 [Dendrothele bispora CBS 962.96]
MRNNPLYIWQCIPASGGQAPVIPDSDEEEPSSPVPAPSRARSNRHTSRPPLPKEQSEDESDKLDEEEELIEDERKHDYEAGRYVDDEMPEVIMGSKSTDDSDDNGREISRDTGTMSPTSQHDSSDNEKEIEVEEEEQKQTRKALGRKAAVLRQELPVILTSPPSVPVIASTNLSEPAWKPHTNIILRPYTTQTRTYKIAMKDQNPSIRKVLNLAQDNAYIMLISDEHITDDTFSPLTVDGLNDIVWAALIRAAEDLEFTGDLNLADRLQRGDEAKYINPMIDYVSQRVTCDRTALKTAHRSTVLAVLGIEHTHIGFAEAKTHILQTSYIYPVGKDGKHDYRASSSFNHPVISRFISAAWFGHDKYSKLVKARKTQLFVSSLPDKPLELEILKAMVAMAACIHAVLQDHSADRPFNFPPDGLSTQWGTFRDLLCKTESANKHKYHKFMHKMYLTTSQSIAPATHGLTRDEILDRIQDSWADFEADNDDD